MKFAKSPFLGHPLPLVTALSAIFLAGCNSTAPTNGGTGSFPTVQGAPTSQNQPYPSNTVPVAENQAVSNVPAANSNYQTALLDEESLDELANLLEATDMKMVEDDKLAIQRDGNLWNRMRAGFAINQNQANPRIEAQKNWFVSRQDYINRLTARASRYLYHTVREAERRNIPTELALLPVIESSYDPTATSNANAAGLWQFIPSTGRIYGLTQSATYDGRRDVVESTRAAYDFLTSLYNQFGSWELALAAYNAGPGRVQRAIDANAAQGLPTDFWSLDLPKETRNYVPRFLAVAQIVGNTDSYSVYLPAIANRQHFRSVPVNYGVDLNQVAELTGIDYDELRMLNPALINGQVDTAGPNRVIIPNAVNTQLDARLGQLGGTGAVSAYAPNVPDAQYNQMSRSSDGLADFATQARAPTQNSSYITPVTPARASGSPAQQQVINSQFAEANVLPTTSATLTRNATIIQEPPLSPEEKRFIADQIRQESPNVGQVVSPIDGNVRLEAIQTQQSILQARGEEKRLSFERPTARPTTPSPTSNTGYSPNQGYNPTGATASNSNLLGARSTYTVQRGDTLSSIASRAGVSWRDIADWNQINPNATLLAGTKLYLYNARAVSPSSSHNNQADLGQASAQPNTYLVRRGDTLIGTANRVGLSVSQLAKYNGLSTNARLRAGQKLWLIPGMVNGSTTTSSTSSNSTYQGSTERYTVKRGESLIGLASRFNVPVATLAAMNDLSTNEQLLIGQRLNVPSTGTSTQGGSRVQSSSTGETSSYKVQSGDTLIGIANKIGSTPAKIASLNNFSASYHLQRGQMIKLPTSEAQVARALSGTPIRYKVQSGDTLIGLANRYNLTPAQLAAANNLAANAQLMRGSTLTIPSADAASTINSSSTATTSSRAPRPSTYKVTSGDTLIGLANRFGISVSALATANNLTTRSQLKIGQQLTIPQDDSGNSSSSSVSNAAVSYNQRYTVKSGDTLIGLARRYGVSSAQLASANDLSTSAQLQIGQRLKVPSTSTSGSRTSSASTSSTSSMTNRDTQSYTVKSGDTLIGLANKYNLSPQALAKENGLASNAQLKIGQKITIPATTTAYTVRSGDSLIKLANRYNIPTSQLASLNNISSDAMLQRGQVLRVPVQ